MISGNREIIILTGGSGGIGSAISKELIRKNYHVFNLDMEDLVPALEETFYPIDLLNFNQLDRLAKGFAREEKIVGFVHCAGYGGSFVDVSEFEESEWDKVYGINVKSAYIILRNLLPFWRSKNFGRFIAIASSQSLVGAKYSVAYSSSKHALAGMVKSLADEWGEFGITSNAISPGYVRTKMGVQDKQVNGHLEKIMSITPSKKIAEPEEIARIVSFLLGLESGYVNGANWTVDGGITSI